jgi:hypothetical protein
VITEAALRAPGAQADPLLELGLGPGPPCGGPTDVDLLLLLLLLLLIAGPGPPTMTTAPPRPLLRPATPPPRWPGGALRPLLLPFMRPEEGPLRMPTLRGGAPLFSLKGGEVIEPPGGAPRLVSICPTRPPRPPRELITGATSFFFLLPICCHSSSAGLDVGAVGGRVCRIERR